MLVLYSNRVWRLLSMPEISRFFGIIIAMYYKEHTPPHFHAKYAGQRAAFVISDLEIIEGSLPRRAVSLVLEWAFEHRQELTENWRRAERQENLLTIPPLD
jgi:hypothetical protein